MARHRWRLLVAIAVLLALALPVVLALAYAGHIARVTVKDRARIYAGEVLHRVDQTTEQVQSAVDRLSALPGPPCSPAHLALMREIDIGSSYIQAVGHTQGDLLVCSSLSEQRAPLPLGPAKIVTPRGARVRTDVRLTPGATTTFVVVEQKGYAAVVHKQLSLDVSNDTRALSLATFSFPSRAVILERGTVDPAWAARGRQGRTVTFMDGSRAVSVAGSRSTYLGAVAGLGPAALASELAEARRQLLPAGVVVGLLLAVLVLVVARRRLALSAELRAGIRRGELHLEYQPVVDLETSAVVGAEALLRWHRPDGQLVRPDVFIQVAEDNGLMPRVTRRVLELARADFSALAAGRPGFHLAVNISSQDIHDEEVVEQLCRLGERAPGCVIVEVTERSLLDRDRAAVVFARLREHGLLIALDDFGTGYSSLSYLEALPLDYLKIDKSFIDSVGAEAATSNVAVHIIEMARALELQLIAEGVETPEQQTFLRAQSVQLAQGWLFGRPRAPGDWPAPNGAGPAWPPD